MFKRNTKKSLSLSVLLLISFLLSAEQIESINIKGLKRTKDETLLSIIDLKPGDGVTPDMKEAIVQKMRKAGIFQEDITVELTPGTEGQILNITAYDRWTLLGIPFFAASSGDMRGGAFLMDSNLRGKSNLFVSSVLFSQSGDIQAFFLFRDPTFRDSEVALSGRTAGGRSSTTYTSLDEKDIWEDYYTNFFNVGTSAGYDLNDLLSLEMGLEGTYRQFQEKSIAPPEEEGGKAVLGWDAGLSFDGTTVFPLFYEGAAANLTGGMNWIPGDIPTWSLSAEARAGWVAGGILLLQASGKGGVTDNPFSTLFHLGGSTGRSDSSLPENSLRPLSQRGSEGRVTPG